MDITEGEVRFKGDKEIGKQCTCPRASRVIRLVRGRDLSEQEFITVDLTCIRR